MDGTRRHRRIAVRLTGSGAAAVALAGTAFAQDPVFPRLERPELPPLQRPGDMPRPEIELPALPPAPPAERLSDAPQFVLRGVRIEGAEALGADVLAPVAQAFIGRAVSTRDLVELRRRLTLAYIDRGYINSGAILPDQDVVDGIITFRMVEGRATAIEVEGLAHLREGYLRERLALGIGPPLRVQDLEEQIRILLQDPLIRRLNVEIAPGLVAGEAIVRARAEEAQRLSASVTMANDQSPSIGGERLRLNVVWRDVTGVGDTISAEFGHGFESSSGSGNIAWAFPLSAYGTRLTLRAETERSQVIESRFRELDIESRSRTLELTLSHPILRTSQRALTLGVTAARRESETFLLDERFAFTEGTDDGKAKISVLRIWQEWIDRQPDWAIALRSTFSFGIDVFGTTDLGVEPNGRSMAWLGQGQIIHRLFDDWQVVGRLDLQLADGPLFPLEQIGIGGQYTVRGYRENQINRDSGIVGSVELRIPILETNIVGPDGEHRGSVVLAPFVDYGHGVNKGGSTPSPRTLVSAGIGFRWDPLPWLQGQIYYAHPFRTIENQNGNLQDVAIHFQLVARLF